MRSNISKHHKHAFSAMSMSIAFNRCVRRGLVLLLALAILPASFSLIAVGQSTDDNLPATSNAANLFAPLEKQAQWEANMLEWGGYLNSKQNTNPYGYQAFADSYYDMMLVFYKIADYTGDTTTWNAAAQKIRRSYRDAYVRNLKGTFAVNTAVGASGGSITINVNAGHNWYAGEKCAFFNRHSSVNRYKRYYIVSTTATTLTLKNVAAAVKDAQGNIIGYTANENADPAYPLNTTDTITTNAGDEGGSFGDPSLIDGRVPGYWVFTQGLYEDWNRTGNLTSKAALASLATNSSYLDTGSSTVGGSDDTYMKDHKGSREAAYALRTLIDYRRAGYTVPDSLITQYANYVFGHFEQWYGINNTPRPVDHYIRPFMVALSSEALIHYTQHVPCADTGKVKQYLETAWEYNWNNLWVVASQAFQYTNRVVSVSTDTRADPDLNLLSVQSFGWLYNQTGDPKWITWGDQIFNGGVSVYNGSVLTSGAYLGSRSVAGASGKHFCQNYKHSFDYIKFRNMPPISSAAAIQDDFNDVGRTDVASISATGQETWNKNTVMELLSGNGFSAQVWSARTPDLTGGSVAKNSIGRDGSSSASVRR